jgi:hypothetical protein
MKNIHVLPTEKPSRLQLQINGKYHLENGQTISLKSYQNIYITSDEEIKEGDYIFETDSNYINIAGKNYIKNETDFKIVISTDEYLIKDGVQAIDDEFLEWFVKNPSCEFVEVVSAKTIPALQLTGNGHCWWKIIIPKEETKTGSITECIKMIIDNQLNELEELKQETLEEDKLIQFALSEAKKWVGESNHHKIATYATAISVGAKWQQEQDKKMYSEVFEWLANKDYLSDEVDIIQKEFEQFKKK